MLYLNLSDGFNPFDSSQEELVTFKAFAFSGGEPHIQIDPNISGDFVTITHRINSFNDLGLLLVAVDAVKRLGGYVEELFIPYFPGARQDRVMTKGESLTAKVYADIINSLGVPRVTIFDPHSDVTPALINGCMVESNHYFVSECYESICSDEEKKPILIVPDAGANKKCTKLAQYLNDNVRVVRCDKSRNVSDGSISGFEVYAEDLEGRPCFIVDDICDGGATFIGIAEELKKKNAGNMYLVVSHGIFSKGIKQLSKYFKKIFTTDSIRSDFDWEQKERDNTDICEIVTINL